MLKRCKHLNHRNFQSKIGAGIFFTAAGEAVSLCPICSDAYHLLKEMKVGKKKIRKEIKKMTNNNEEIDLSVIVEKLRE